MTQGALSDYTPARTTRRLFISTGEVSGDLQGSLLIEALYRRARQRRIDLAIVALGGDRMAQAGAHLLSNTVAIGSIGILEALPFILPTLKVQRRAKEYLLKQPPDLVVMIDYKDPNLVMGRFLKERFPQIPMVYYIAPHLWVWQLSPRETQMVVSLVDWVLAIFPEEARHYRKSGGNVAWVGHPLLDRIPQPPDTQAARQRLGIPPERRVVTLLPASRQQELTRLMPVIFAAAQQIQAALPQVEFLIPLSIARFRQPIEAAIARYGLQARVLEGDLSRDAIAAADLAIAKSGTANLEIALMNVPQVVVYRLHPVTAWIAQRVLKSSIPFASPVNLVDMKPIVPELLQAEATPDNIFRTSLDLLTNQDRRQAMLADYAQMRQSLGEVGVCDRAADLILDLLPP